MSSILRLQTPTGHRLIVNARRESIVLMQDGDTSFTFDREGRLVGAFLDGKNYRRSIGNEILEKQSGPRPGLSGRLRRLLSHDEVRALEERAYAFARDAAELVRASATELKASQNLLGLEEERSTILDALAVVHSCDYARLEREREEYARIYRPVTILPPDQYLALYVQATEGCAYNNCRFCGFYRDREYRVKPLDEFRRHLRDVRAFLGRGLSLRRSIFLGDANALMIPQDELVARLDVIHDEFGDVLQEADDGDSSEEELPRFSGIYSFVDAVPSHRRTPAEYQELASRGLRRVYVGLESGDAGLLRFLGKPHRPGDVAELVADLKGGGVAIGVIILIGAGGARFEEAHIRETAELVNRLGLDEKDLIYFSEVVDYPGSTYSARAAEAGITPLRADEIDQQMARLRASFTLDREHAPRVSFYDIREFVY